MAMKTLILAVLITWVESQTYATPTNMSGFPAYSLSDYVNYRCQGNSTCSNIFPNVSALIWTPEGTSKIW